MARAEETDEQPPLAIAPAVVRNAHFEVQGDDMLSAQYVATVGELFVSRFSRMLPQPGRARQPVMVNLLSREETRAPAAIVTRYFPAGHASVSIPWHVATDRQTVERALVQGHLTFLSASYGAGAVNVPLWLEVAGQHLARVQAIPSHANALGANVRKGRAFRLEEILEAQRDNEMDERFEAHAYWLLMFLEREGRARGRLQNFLVRILRGEQGLPALVATYGGQIHDVEEAGVWWLVGLGEMTRSAASPMLSMEESGQRVRELSRFTFESDSGARRIFADDLWEQRESRVVRREISHRLRTLQIELGAIHPFYHNALISLGQTLDAVEAGSEEDFYQNVLALQQDMRAGDELVAETSSVLADLSAELGN